MNMRILCAALFVALFAGCDGKVVGALVLPHGDVALDPSRYAGVFNKTQLAEAFALHDCAKSAGNAVAALRPDAIFLDSPHGIADRDRIAFFLNTRAAGDVETEGEPPGRFNFSAPLQQNITLKVVASLERALPDGSVAGMTAFGEDEAFPIRWGEVIPLWFLPRVPVVIATQPTRRLTEPVAMIPYMQDFGEKLWTALEQCSERIVVVISADLAHTHDPDGPYGFSPAAQPFDDAVAAWATTLNSTMLTKTAAAFAPKALSCGFTGLVMFDALLHCNGVAWKPTLCTISHPSYYGMMVASFTR